MVLRRLGTSRGVVVALLAAAAVCGGFLYVILRERQQNMRLSGAVTDLKEQRVELEGAKGRLEQTLEDREAELEVANTKNYRADMLRTQDALKEVNQKLQKIIRNQAELENTNFILDSRLKNTTKELTKSLEELSQARALLAGVDNPYKVKMAQMAENMKAKEQQYMELQQRFAETERSLVAYQAQGEGASEGARRYQERLEVLSGNIATLRAELLEKSRLVEQKDARIGDLMIEVERARTSAQQEAVAGAVESLKGERDKLREQIASSQAQLKTQQDELVTMNEELAKMRAQLFERNGLLEQKEREVVDVRAQAESLKRELTLLRSGQEVLAQGAPDASKVYRELEVKIRELERDNAELEKKIAEAERQTAGRQREKEDPFRDRNLRLMTEQLVKKEEEIRSLSDEVTALKKEKEAWQKSFGPREKRMAELEILVNTLTKQLGDYAATIERREAELSASAKQIALLTEEVEAQKVAALALQKELAEARARQERTLQKLTQIMSMNTDGTGPDDMDFTLYEPATSSSGPDISRLEGREDPAKVRRRVEELKKQVEVLMEKK